MLRQALTASMLVAALGSAIVSGTFFAFSTFIMRSLQSLPAPQGIAAMQSINLVVVRSSFIVVFLATALLSLGLALSALFSGEGDARGYLIAASALYLVGSIGVTMVFNVPRNDMLAALDPTEFASAAVWEGYVRAWTFWNHVRAVASALAAVGFVIAARLS